jgi:hypothetical protein
MCPGGKFGKRLEVYVSTSGETTTHPNVGFKVSAAVLQAAVLQASVLDGHTAMM